MTSIGTGLTLLLLALATLPALAGEVGTLPPAPVILPTATTADVHAFEKTGSDYIFTNPYIPPVSNSQDHRIGLVRKQGPGGTARFVLLAPERLTVPVMEVDGAEILSPTIVSVDASQFHAATPTSTHTPKIDHLALCDPKEPTPNPRTCGNADCYDMKAITGMVYVDHDSKNGTDPPYLELWSVPVTVEVSSPKTTTAAIAQVSVDVTKQVSGPPIHGASSAGIRIFHTPMVVGDNRLLVVRLGPTTELTWQDAQGQTHTTRSDPTYAVYPDDGDPSVDDECDVTQWTDLLPLVNAPQDSDVNTRYGFAMHPFTSPSGAAVPATYNLRGRYLWVDQEADNVFFGTLSRLLHDDHLGNGACGMSGDCLYDIACVPGVPCALDNSAPSEITPPHQGWMMMGLWTHGKMVLLDSLINHSDFGLHAEEEHHRMVTLYDNASAVRVGSANDADRVAGAFGWIDTTVQLGSTEHFFNMVPEMRPQIPRDVVWHVTAGAQTDTIPFDDYISDKALIFSPMNALKEMVGIQAYYDGNDPDHPAMRLQNAATSPDFVLPAYGEVVVPAGTNDKGRIENVALGGIKARGFYLDPESHIDYTIPTQSGLESEEWVISLFYDLKVVSGQVRRLFTFPSNNNYIELHGLWNTRICGGGFGCTSVRLPKQQSTSTWTHLAYHLVGNKVRLYQDGFLFAEVDRPTGMQIEPGTFTVGSPGAGTLGVGGWIDELRVMAGPFNPEQLCNHAHGTLVAVPHTYASLTGNPLAVLVAPFEAAAAAHAAETDYPNFLSGRDAVHDALHGTGAVFRPTSDLYVCNIDYTRFDGAKVEDPGDPQARPLRRRLLFPEGRLVWNHPRPDSTSNDFCLSCHQAGSPGGLGLDPLALDTTAASYEDEHRQPSQPPRQIFGHLPAGYFGTAPTSVPAIDQVDPEIDRWLDDGPLYRWTLDEAGGSAFLNWELGDVTQASNGGTFQGQTFFKPGAGRGHALAFDGDGDSAPVDHNLSIEGDALTLSAWFRPYRSSGIPSPLPAPEDRCRIDVGVDSPCTLIAKSLSTVDWSLQAFYLADDPAPRWRARLEVRGDDGTLHALEVDLDDPTTPATGDFVGTAWHHLAGTYGDGILEIYLDGASMGSAPVTARPLATNPNHPVTLGSELDALGNPAASYYGRLDDVRVWDRRLRADEIAELAVNSP